MALAAMQSATCFPGRPVGRRLLATGRFPAVQATSASRARATRVTRGIRVQAGGSRDSQPPTPPWDNKRQPAATPPWERAAEDDGLDWVRLETQQYALRSREEKLMAVLQELKADERKYLKWFAAAKDKGDEGEMRRYHERLKEATDRMNLLLANPRKFVRDHGQYYGLRTDADRFWYIFRACLTILFCVFVIFLSLLVIFVALKTME